MSISKRIKKELDFKERMFWFVGSRQHIICEPGETKKDAIKYMRAHLKYYKRQDLDFDEKEIVQEGDVVIITLRSSAELWKLKMKSE